MDYECMTLPLILRNMRPGDRVEPLGTGGTKKLKDYFIDRKIAALSPGRDSPPGRCRDDRLDRRRKDQRTGPGDREDEKGIESRNHRFGEAIRKNNKSSPVICRGEEMLQGIINVAANRFPS